jgi:hypothetical protein
MADKTARASRDGMRPDVAALVDLLSRVAYRRLQCPRERVKLPESEEPRESRTLRPLFDRQAKR